MYYQSEWDGMYDLIIVVRNQSKTSKVIFLVNISYFVLRKYVYTHMKITLFTYRQSENKYEIFQDSSSIYFTCIGTLIFVMCNGNQNVVTSFEICRLEIGR